MRRFKNNYEKNRNLQRAQRGGDREPSQPADKTPDPVEELPWERPELETFGVEWVRAWVPHARKRLVEIAKVMRRYPWMVGVVRQRLVASSTRTWWRCMWQVDGSEACLSLNQLKAYCARGGAVREVKLELTFSRYEVYEEKIREVYRPKGLLAFTTATREYVRLL
jgi:hypothetical protein